MGVQFSSVQLLNRVRLFVTPWTSAHQAPLSITNSQSPPKPMSIESVMPSSYLILCRPLLLPSIFPSIRVFFNESALCITSPKYWSFRFSISPSNEQDWFPLGWTGWFSWQSKGLSRVFSNITVQKHQFFGAVFFIVHLSHPYMTTGKTIPLTVWIFVDKVMSLLFNMLSMLVIAFIPRSKCILISWLQSPSTVILELKKVKSFPNCLPWSDGTRWTRWNLILVFWMLSFKPASFKPAFSLSLCTLNKSLFSSSSLSAIRMVSCAYLRLLIFLPATLIPVCDSASHYFTWCTLHISYISKVTIYILDILLSQVQTSPWFHVQF